MLVSAYARYAHLSLVVLDKTGNKNRECKSRSFKAQFKYATDSGTWVQH